jgi:hypothetical protein
MLAALSDELLLLHVERIFARAAGLDTADEAPSPVIPTLATATIDGSQSPAAAEPGRDGHVGTGGKTGELEIQHAILELMLDGEEWSNGELKARLASILPLTEADRGVGARTAEELWENRVNNALSRARPSSLYAKGFVENCGHGIHVITPAGSAYIRGQVDIDKLGGPERESQVARRAAGE